MLFALAFKQTWRHPVRSLLTVLGVATGMFLFTTVETAQDAVREATQVRAGDEVLIVYRQNRFCPFTSRLPEHYLPRLERVPGVAEAVPVKIVVNNCGTSFDVVTPP
jgi:putative ABC transport system permease protein